MRAKTFFTILTLLFLTSCQTSCTPNTIDVGCNTAELIAAINDANAGTNLTTLNLAQDCEYNLTAVDNNIDWQEEFTGEAGGTGLPPITTRVIIEGNNATIQRYDREGTPDFRGVWEVYDGPLKGHVERIEQCGNRVVITGGFVIHDMRADGTLENGVNDINEMTGEELHVAALFEDGRLNLRLNNKTLVVSRRLEGDELVWVYGPFTNRLKRLKEPPERE